jgi:pilus assembly protein Flp/PilA
MSIITKILRDESGATAIEYGLIAALVSVAAIAALTAMSKPCSISFRPNLKVR